MSATIDLFAGPGGWDTGAAALGLRPLGIEWDDWAVRTGQTAGHLRYQADVSALDPLAFHGTDGLIASPPCQGFSMAGKGRGRADAVLLLGHLARVRTAADLDQAIACLHDAMSDDRSLLVLEPLRWALALTPQWLAWEQVPTVLPIWEACATILRAIGYTVATGNLQAEQYGVPQTRKRAILVARSPQLTAQYGPVALPSPTHSRYYPRSPKRLDPGVLPWVSMAQALSWGMAGRPAPTVTGGGTAAGGAEPIAHLRRYVSRDDWVLRGNQRPAGSAQVDDAGYQIRPATSPAMALTGQIGSFQWAYRNGSQAHAAVRDLDRPAPTVHFGRRLNDVQWVQRRDSGPGASRTPRPLDTPSYTIRAHGSGSHPSGVEWVPRSALAAWPWLHAPATTVAGDPRITAREHHDHGEQGKTSLRVSVEEAAILQSFPAAYPWQGTRTAQYRQVGDAVPPLLALHVIAAASGITPAAPTSSAQQPSTTRQ